MVAVVWRDHAADLAAGLWDRFGVRADSWRGDPRVVTAYVEALGWTVHAITPEQIAQHAADMARARELLGRTKHAKGVEHGAG